MYACLPPLFVVNITKIIIIVVCYYIRYTA